MEVVNERTRLLVLRNAQNQAVRDRKVTRRGWSSHDVTMAAASINTMLSVLDQDSLAQWLEHAIADRRVACSNHAGVLYVFLPLLAFTVIQLQSHR